MGAFVRKSMGKSDGPAVGPEFRNPDLKIDHAHYYRINFHDLT